jgi:uncharacterized membrane protein YjjP (DUF1212 family)
MNQKIEKSERERENLCVFASFYVCRSGFSFLSGQLIHVEVGIVVIGFIVGLERIYGDTFNWIDIFSAATLSF